MVASSLTKLDERLTGYSQAVYEPCGFCGRTGTCKIALEKPSRALVPSSDCPQFYKFSLEAAAASTDSGPSTNRPVGCILCQEREGLKKRGVALRHVHWSYNLPWHLASEHEGRQVPVEFQKSIQVTTEELGRFGLEEKQGNAKRKAGKEPKSTKSKKARMPGQK